MSEETEMKVDPSRAAALIGQLTSVSERVAAVAKGRAVSSDIRLSMAYPPSFYVI
jgi:hypothetical protein